MTAPAPPPGDPVPPYVPPVGPGWPPSGRGRRRWRVELGLLIVAVPLLVIGVLVASSAVQRAGQHRAFAGGVTVSGTVSVVVLQTIHQGGGTTRDYIETIDFDVAGQQHSIVSTSEDGEVPAGSTVTVSYRPGNPDGGRWVQPSRLGSGVVAGSVVGGIGLVALLVALGVTVRRRGRRA